MTCGDQMVNGGGGARRVVDVGQLYCSVLVAVRPNAVNGTPAAVSRLTRASSGAMS